MQTGREEKVIIGSTPSHYYNAMCGCPDCRKFRDGGGNNWWDLQREPNHQARMEQLEQKVFRELVLENVIVRAVTDHGHYNSLTQYDMLLEMVVALAETNKQLTDQIIQGYSMMPKPMVIHCTPEQAALLMQPGEIKRMDDL